MPQQGQCEARLELPTYQAGVRCTEIGIGVAEHRTKRESLGTQVVRIRLLSQGHRHPQSEFRGPETHSKSENHYLKQHKARKINFHRKEINLQSFGINTDFLVTFSLVTLIQFLKNMFLDHIMYKALC